MVLPNNNQGIVLIYSLLIIGLITAIALTMSIIIVNELKLTSSSTDATLAYYAAESGIEKGLHTVKIKRNDPTSTLASAIVDIKLFNATLSNDSFFDDIKTVSKTAVIENRQIDEDQFLQADYYDFENPLNPSAGSIAESLKVTNTGNNPTTWAEVSWIAWSANGTLGESTTAKKIIGPTDLQNGWTINNLDVFIGFTPVGYRVRVKALFGELSSISVTPFKDQNGEGEQVVLPSTVEIKAIGEHGSFKQSLTATVPWKIPLFGLYDYVLFSEESLIKTLILSRQIYTSGPIEVEADNITAGACTGCSGAAGDCRALGWTAVCCSAGATCDPSLGSCTVNDGTSNSWVLPIPDYVPADEDYYISIRAKYDNSLGKLKLILGSACKEVLYPATTEYVTCTLPDADFNTIPNSNIKFSQSGTGIIDVDWYMVSTFKVYDDCANVIACTAPTPDCGNCVCESGENCAADSLDCTDDLTVCKAPACTNGCQIVNLPDLSIDPDCPGGVCCTGACTVLACNVDVDCNDVDACTIDTCSAGGTCAAACVNTPIVACTPGDGCCPAGCSLESDGDTDCPPSAPPSREYLRNIAQDEDIVDLTTLSPGGKSMRIIPAWQSQRDAGTIDLRGVWAADTLNVWSVGFSDIILNSSDGGTTWTSQTSPTSGQVLASVYGVDASNLWAVGQSGSIIYTTNGGSTWTAQTTSPVAGTITGVWAFDTNNVWIVEAGGHIYKCSSSCNTTNPTWTDQLPAGTLRLNAIFGLDSSNLWAVGNDRQIWITSNGGSTWVDKRNDWGGSLSGNLNLNTVTAVSVSGITHVWAAGLEGFGNGIMVHSSNAGINWSEQAIPIDVILYGLAAYEENNSARAIAVSLGARTFYYDSSNWIEQTSGSTDALFSAFALNVDNIWTVGQTEIIRFANAPGVDIFIGDNFNQNWYSRQFTSLSIGDGNYSAGFNMTVDTGGNSPGSKVKFVLTVGYCDDSGGSGTKCDEAADFIPQAISGELQIGGNSPAFVVFNNFASGSPFSCINCRLYYNLTVNNTGNSLEINVSGREFDFTNDLERNSYFDLP